MDAKKMSLSWRRVDVLDPATESKGVTVLPNKANCIAYRRNRAADAVRIR